MRKLIVVCTFLLLLLFSACKPSVPREYIQPDEMEDILYDYHLVQAMARQGRGDSMYYRRYYNFLAVLQKHQVTEAEFDSSLVYYYSHMDYLYKVYEHVEEHVENETKRLGISTAPVSSFDRYKAEGDTANIWNYATSAILKPVAPYNRMDFDLQVDTTFKKGDAFQFNFVADFVYQSGSKDATLYIAVTYDNDSVASFSTHTSVSGFSQLRVPGDTAHHIRKIAGFLYLDRGSDDSNTLKLMLVSHIQLIRFHAGANAEATLPQQNEPVDNNIVNTPEETGPSQLSPPTSPLRIQVDSSKLKKGKPLKMKDVRFR